MSNTKKTVSTSSSDKHKTSTRSVATKNKKTKKSVKQHTADAMHFIVGIGASAGGLEAIIQLLKNLPSDTGMSFVVVQHLDPNHKSLAAEIFRRHTSMTVAEVKSGMQPKPNYVYVIPAGYSISITQGAMKLTPRIKNKQLYLPIDFFFKSLANDQKSKAIAIILSGTASDGTLGLTAIKEEGGFTIAQCLKSAAYDGMPRHAIESGSVDMVLSPKQIAKELVNLHRHPLLTSSVATAQAIISPKDDENTAVLGKIFLLLQSHFHVDFSHYKVSTLKRRITRRMILQKKDNLKSYLDYIQTDPEEVKSLFADILIHVTEFFRNPNSFAKLKQEVIPEIIKNKAPNSPIRIWVVGCASGEEAYSIAITLLESIGKPINNKQIQIFATDISESVIQKARQGSYSESINKNVSEQRLEKFFIKTDAGYTINKSIREMCLFSLHDVSHDPPFAKLDLICCRNLLIYFDKTLQKRILPIFHYALNPGGYLWLGSSEGVGDLSSLFSPVNKAHKFYVRKHAPAAPKLKFLPTHYSHEKLDLTKKPTTQTQSILDIQRETDRLASLRYAPPGVVVNSEMEVVLIRGEPNLYLKLTQGQASLNLFKMVRPELAADLRISLQAAKKKNVSVRKNNVTFYIGEQHKTCNIDITPLTILPQSREHFFLISFEPTSKNLPLEILTTATTDSQSKQINNFKNKHIQELEHELADIKAYQHTLIQDFESTQQELTATNEELQSTNEEFQSTNEELETAKEELQSINEELTTVNDELQNRNVNLDQVNNDLINLLGAIDMSIVIIDINACIRRFTPRAGEMMNLIPSDVGRSIGDINPNIDVPNMKQIVLEVIRTVTIKELDVQNREHKWFRLQIRPYNTMDKKIDGAIVTLLDIDVLKQNLRQSNISLAYTTSIFNTVQIPLVVLDQQSQIQSANQAFHDKFDHAVNHQTTDFLSFLSSYNKKILADLRKALTEVRVSNKELNNMELEYAFSSTETWTLLLNARQIQWIDSGRPIAVLLSIQDITERCKLEKSLKEAVTLAKEANRTKDIFLAMLSHELRTPLTSILAWAQLLQSPANKAKLQRGLSIIEQSALAQGQLLSDLFDISRIQSGKIVLDISNVNPADIVLMVVESARPLAAKKSITIKTHILPVDGTVAVDLARLQQVIWNLLNNAIKFSFAEGVINVYVSPIVKQGQHFVSIQVSDRGKGIQADFLPKLFDRFTQEDSNTTRAHDGLGIGLTIVYDLLKLLGGTIQAKSKGPGKGASFIILLPLLPNNKKQQRQAKLLFKEQSEKEIMLQQKLIGMKILLVENETSTLDALSDLLKTAGAIAIPTTSAAEALVALDKYKPDIILSDVGMPDEDGYTLIRKIRLRKPSQSGTIPAIALTAYITKDDTEQAFAAGFDAHLVKPFNAADLFRMIIDLTKR